MLHRESLVVPNRLKTYRRGWEIGSFLPTSRQTQDARGERVNPVVVGEFEDESNQGLGQGVH